MTPRQAALAARVGSWIVRLLIATLRIRVDDQAGALHGKPGASIWLFWHNRLFIIPYLYERYFPAQRTAALTSASKDGEILAAFLACFGIGAIRGSSSRRGATATRELIRALRDEYIVAFTPDGPRGPIYRLHPGIVLVAQKTEVPILPIRVQYSRYWEFKKAWDRFQVPKPFARVDITLLPVEKIPPTADEPAFEAELSRLEAILRQDQAPAEEPAPANELPT